MPMLDSPYPEARHARAALLSAPQRRDKIETLSEDLQALGDRLHGVELALARISGQIAALRLQLEARQ